MNSTINKIQLF